MLFDELLKRMLAVFVWNVLPRVQYSVFDPGITFNYLELFQRDVCDELAHRIDYSLVSCPERKRCYLDRVIDVCMYAEKPDL